MDCGGHIVTITEFDDAYGAVKEPENEFESVDDEVMDESELMAGGSTGDQRKVRTDSKTREALRLLHEVLVFTYPLRKYTPLSMSRS